MIKLCVTSIFGNLISQWPHRQDWISWDFFCLLTTICLICTFSFVRAAIAGLLFSFGRVTCHLGMCQLCPTFVACRGGDRIISPDTLYFEHLVGHISDHKLNFFLFPFFANKSLSCLEGKSMTPCQGNTFLFCFSHQLPRLRLGPMKGFLSWHGALQGPLTRLVRCFWNYRETRTPSGMAH